MTDPDLMKRAGQIERTLGNNVGEQMYVEAVPKGDPEDCQDYNLYVSDHCLVATVHGDPDLDDGSVLDMADSIAEAGGVIRRLVELNEKQNQCVVYGVPMSLEAAELVRGLELDKSTLYAEITKLNDRWNREVEGLNNEGDPIGGPPARGMRHYAQMYLDLRHKLAELINWPSTNSQAEGAKSGP